MKQRNEIVDILRGIAILMVVLGHTISGCVEEYAESFVFNVIWSLQMPLFFLLSGYVTRYSKVICSAQMLKHFTIRKTTAYLVPWLVWTFFVRGFVFGEHAFFDFRYLFWHMDSGYWFLTSLWTIVLAYGVSQFVAAKVVKEEQTIKCLLVSIACFAFFAVLLLGLGMIAGLSFFGIKLTVYYMPFYALGVLFGKRERICSKENRIKVDDIAVALACLIYFALITRFDLFAMGESVEEIVIRILTSLTGCAALCGVVSKAFAAGQVQRMLKWAGTHSLELYLVHYLLLYNMTNGVKPAANSLDALGICAVNYNITVILSMLFIWLIEQNYILRKSLFWR